VTADHSRTADACTTPPINRGEGIMASIRLRNYWDDPEADKADKEDKRALLLVFVAMIAICGAAVLLT
jgi:hypothetical protein